MKQIQRKRLLPVLWRRLQQPAPGRSTHVGDQDVHAAQGRGTVIDEPLHVARPSDVRHHAVRVDAERSGARSLGRASTSADRLQIAT